MPTIDHWSTVTEHYSQTQLTDNNNNQAGKACCAGITVTASDLTTGHFSRINADDLWVNTGLLSGTTTRGETSKKSATNTT